MKIKRSYSGYLTDDNLQKIKSRDTKLTDYICSMLNNFSLILTLIYNIFWFFYFRNILVSLDNTNLLSENDRLLDLKGFISIYNMANNIILWTIISFLKAILFLFCSKLLCGNENDCNILCLIIKILTSFIPGIFFIYSIPDVIYNYSFNTVLTNSDSFNKTHSLCDNLAKAIQKFYIWEYSYIIIILFVFCFIPFAAVCMCVKEIWKSRGYDNKGE